MHKYCTDVMIHIDEDLADHEIHSLERDISSLPGVYSACVNDRTRHLMLVDYDPEGVHALDLLSTVLSRGVSAELVGL
ncbi:MAG: heavy-metal-associated domain-containing protein [Chromatiaceae bacterium]|nr:heavy-metal-associated domain-containing protein [Gammaproteobacteria bacterium]MCP5307016.1 heavy-metal-associated domain-containing protein [Chromatiaceae bacterium]MCP5313324.1 heavy-metal-associated domain-containing protein [Chromatiaceae bacterium]